MCIVFVSLVNLDACLFSLPPPFLFACFLSVHISMYMFSHKFIYFYFYFKMKCMSVPLFLFLLINFDIC